MDPKLLEICFNLWPVIDESSQTVYAYLGKTYALRGSEKEKLSTLQCLAPNDHVTVSKRPIPARFELIDNGEPKPGVTTMEIVSNPESQFWEELITQLGDELPPVVNWLGGREIQSRFPLSENPLTCITPLVESDAGVRRPLIEPKL